MRQIPEVEVDRRIRTENIWWDGATIGRALDLMQRRPYFDLLYPLVRGTDVRRAVLIMGPRRVGKTVLIHHVVQQLVRDGVPPQRICYVSVDHPLYNGCGLVELFARYLQSTGTTVAPGVPIYMFFDEVQYLKDWEHHLKSLVDSFPDVKFIASGSAAAALKMKSTESGAGRFTDFLLPPLTFYEYMLLLDKNDLMHETGRWFGTVDIHALNEHFVHYLNFGGYPEVIFSDAIQQDLARFIKSDIIDKVLLRDLPKLYGIHDIQELNSLFTTLAFNTADELSLERLSQNSGVAKNTIKRYIEYLEAAFLIKTVHRVDRRAKKFQRATTFKVYLTNPSIRSALFAPISAEDAAFGDLVETGAYSQWFHSIIGSQLRYARWDGGEVDLVCVQAADTKPAWVTEIKWSDRTRLATDDLHGVIAFCKSNDMKTAVVTSRTVSSHAQIDGVSLTFLPASLYCYTVGYDVIKGKYQVQGVKLPKP